MHARAVGSHALLVEVEDFSLALSLAAWARSQPLDVVDIVPAATTVLFDGVASPAALVEALKAWTPTSESVRGDLVEIAVVYDGVDLDYLAEAWQLSRDEVPVRHSEIKFVSAFCGFVPGFSWLSGLPAELAVPRLDSPRSKVPAGSVAVAGRWGAVYPLATPGGWRILGHTDAVLWDQDRAEPALLPPGTRVRFVPA